MKRYWLCITSTDRNGQKQSYLDCVLSTALDSAKVRIKKDFEKLGLVVHSIELESEEEVL